MILIFSDLQIFPSTRPTQLFSMYRSKMYAYIYFTKNSEGFENGRVSGKNGGQNL